MRICPIFARKTVIPVLLLFLFAFYINAPAQIPLLWGDLKPGPYAVGFRSVEKYDYSRTFSPKYDYDGELREGVRARPIQICIWYPAAEEAESSPMVYGEYVYSYPEDSRFIDVLSNLQTRELQYLNSLIGNNFSLVLDLMNIKIGAFRDAPHVEGTFPLIIYHPHNQSGFSENAVLCEYLASHGFIVATSHSLGTGTLSAGFNAVDMETLARDKEYIYAFMHEDPHVDNNKLGLLGGGFGGLTSLVMQRRNGDVDAVACLQGLFLFPEFAEFAMDTVFLDAGKVHVPLLIMYADDDNEANLSFIDSCTYSSRYIVELDGMQPADFSQYGLISAMAPDTTGVSHETGKRGYETVCRYVLHFFRAQLNGDEASLQFFNSFSSRDAGLDFVTVSHVPAEPLPPDEDQFVEFIRKNGAYKAAEILEKFRRSDPDLLIFREATLNFLGYEFLNSNRIEEAAEIFRMNTVTYPNSANVWDSYSESCLARGEIELGVECTKKALELLPSDTTINEQFKELIRNNAEQRLKDYEGQQESD